MDTSLPSIAFFMHDLSGGGVERMRLRLAAGLAARGHAVSIIVQCVRGELRAEVPSGIDLIELGRIRTWMSVCQLARVLRARRPDILVSSLDHNNVAALCARVLAGSATKIVICQHNALSAEASRGWRYRVVPLLYRALARWADGIVAVSEGVAADLAATAGMKRARLTVIHNPVIADTQAACAPAPPHPWLAEQSAPVFLFVGRLVAQKDPALLLRAFALRRRLAPARLIILGDGPLMAALREQVCELGMQDAVHFAGYVRDPLPWMVHATSLVLPSRYEGFGNVIVEALACGTPVIATDCPHGPGEILAGGRFGWLVPVGDATALAAAMEDDVRGSFRAEKLARRAQAYSVFACVTRHQALFERVLHGGGPRHAFGLVFSRLDADAVCARMVQQPPNGEVRLVVTPNLDHVRLMREQPAFAAACRAAAVICPDGFPVAIYAWWRRAGAGARTTGCAIFHALAARAADHRRRILVVAESEKTAVALRAWAHARGVGSCWAAIVAPAGLLDDAAGQRQLVAGIIAAKPDILIVTLGAPVSEIFVHRHCAALPPCWALCCGQAVRVELGLERRAPAALQWLNLEWAWRMFREPRRLGPRYLRVALALPALVLMDKFMRESTAHSEKG